MPRPSTLDTGTRLAVERTFLARERTMMAWVRTAASMISFGFTIYKFFDLELAGRQSALPRPIGADDFALLLIGTGLGGLVLGFLEHRRSMRFMRATYGEVIPGSSAGLVAGVVAALGVFA